MLVSCLLLGRRRSSSRCCALSCCCRRSCGRRRRTGFRNVCIRSSRPWSEIARIAKHVGGQVVYDLRFIQRHFKQSCVENFLPRIHERLCDLLSNTRAFERQVLSLQPFLFELENVPTSAIEVEWISKASNFHWTKQPGNQVLRKAVLLEFLFSSPAEIASLGQRVGILAFRASHRCEIGTPLERLIDPVNLDLCFGLVFRVTVRDTLTAVISRVDHDHRQPDAASINKLLLVIVVILLDLAVTNTDFAGILILQPTNGEVLARFFL